MCVAKVSQTTCASYPDYVPTNFPSEYFCKISNKGKMERYERMKTRRSETLIHEEAQVAVEEHAEIEVVLQQGQEADKSTDEEAGEQGEEQVDKELEEEQYHQEEAMEAGTFLVDQVDRGTQTDATTTQ